MSSLIQLPLFDPADVDLSSPELRIEYSRRARELFRRFGGVTGPAIGPGACSDCHAGFLRRERYGTLELCLGCAGRRRAAAAKLAADAAAGESRQAA